MRAMKKDLRKVEAKLPASNPIGMNSYGYSMQLCVCFCQRGLPNIQIQKTGPDVASHSERSLPASDLGRYLHNFSNRAGSVAV